MNHLLIFNFDAALNVALCILCGMAGVCLFKAGKELGNKNLARAGILCIIAMGTLIIAYLYIIVLMMSI